MKKITFIISLMTIQAAFILAEEQTLDFEYDKEETLQKAPSEPTPEQIIQQNKINQPQDQTPSNQQPDNRATALDHDNTQGIKLDLIKDKAKSHYEKNSLLTKMSTSRYMDRVNELSPETKELLSKLHDNTLKDITPEEAASLLEIINKDIKTQEKKWNLGIIGDRSQHLIDNLEKIKKALANKNSIYRQQEAQLSPEEKQQKLDEEKQLLQIPESDKQENQKEHAKNLDRDEERAKEVEQKNIDEGQRKTAEYETKRKEYLQKQAEEDAQYQADQEAKIKAEQDEYQRITAENEAKVKADRQKMQQQDISREAARQGAKNLKDALERINLRNEEEKQRKIEEEKQNKIKEEQRKQTEQANKDKQAQEEQRKQDQAKKAAERAAREEKDRKFHERVDTAYKQSEISAQEAAKKAQEIKQTKINALQEDLTQNQKQLSELESSQEYQKIYTIHDMLLRKKTIDALIEEKNKNAENIQNEISNLMIQRDTQKDEVLSTISNMKITDQIKKLRTELNNLLNGKEISQLKEQQTQIGKELENAYQTNKLSPNEAESKYFELRSIHSKLTYAINTLQKTLNDYGIIPTEKPQPAPTKSKSQIKTTESGKKIRIKTIQKAVKPSTRMVPTA